MPPARYIFLPWTPTAALPRTWLDGTSGRLAQVLVEGVYTHNEASARHARPRLLSSAKPPRT